jgi:hypothetical protein
MRKSDWLERFMSTGPLDRARLVSRTRALQVGAGALLCAGVAIAMVGLPFMSAPPAPVIDIGPEVIGPTVRPEVKSINANVDFDAIAQRLSMISNRPTVPVVEPVVVAGEPKVVEAPAVVVVDLGKFLGTVQLGNLTMGLISKEEKQTFVKVGDKVGEHTVTNISPKEITLAGPAGVDTTLELAPKGGDMVTHAAAGAGGGGGGVSPFGNRQQTPRGVPGAMNPAMMAAQRASVAGRVAQLNKGTTFTPASAMNAGGMQNYQNIMADPARRARFAEIQNKLRSSGEYKSQTDVDEAAAKMTEEEFLSNMGNAPGKGVK